MRTTLVTGGAGFIGAHLTRDLLDLGHRVIVLDDLSGGARDNVDARATFVEGTVLDYALLARLFDTHRFDYVYHLAAYAAEGLSHFVRRFNYTNNLIGSVNLINESVRCGVKCFVFTSSIAVYGSQTPPMTEAMTPRPEDPYGIAKFAVEQDLRAAHELFGLDYIIFRPHNVYGEYQNIGDRYRNVAGIFMRQLMAGEPLSVFGDGTQTRAFSSIGVVTPGMARSVDVPAARNEVFNIGADETFSVGELARTVMEVMGVEGEIRFFPARNEVVHAAADHAKAAQILDVRPRTPLREGLARMAAWAKKVGARSSARFKEIEIHKNLPAAWLEDSEISMPDAVSMT